MHGALAPVRWLREWAHRRDNCKRPEEAAAVAFDGAELDWPLETRGRSGRRRGTRLAALNDSNSRTRRAVALAWGLLGRSNLRLCEGHAWRRCSAMLHIRGLCAPPHRSCTLAVRSGEHVDRGMGVLRHLGNVRDKSLLNLKRW